MSHWKRRFIALAALAGAVAFATHASAADNICFVYVSPIGEAGWTYQHDRGRKQMEKETQHCQLKIRKILLVPFF